MAFNSLFNEIIFIITDDLGPKDLSLLLRTARRFNTVLSVKFYDIALTYTRTSGETVLLWAALHNREATFKSLLERGADMSIQDKDGDTALHHLATKGNLPLLTLLLQHRQLQHSHKIDIRNDKGETSLLCAVQAGNEEAVDQLLQAGADSSASSAAESKDEARRQSELEFRENNRIRMQIQERAEEHIRREYNVKEHREAFKAPLHVAAEKGHINIVKLLLNADADVWTAAYHGIALDYAAIEEHEDVFQLLCEAGINAHRKDHFDMTAFLSTVDALKKNSQSSSQNITNVMQEEDIKYEA